MTVRLFAFRTDRLWPIALVAAVTWVQPWVLVGFSAAWWLVALWALFLTLGAVPLAIADPLRFRRTSLVIGGAVLGTQVALAVPYLLIPLPFVLALFPAGLLLLLAGGKRCAPARGLLAALLLVIPATTAFTTLLPPR
ncbi:hypothetical protein AB0O91_01570 [Kitasatospora sp. NPDC089797]|uniref:hypothetical protein n=1 Tax=Kitasatospora sp. NPDC089797 TaxID=3155298 RepID=UPI00344383BC